MSPDRRKHRGAHPADKRLFAPDQLHPLRMAVEELSWLLERGYTTESSLKLVGDRHRLTARQRTAVRRASCSDQESVGRAGRELSLGDCGPRILIDGFNLIVTVEAAVAGGVLLLCRDGAIRDLASVHGSYRKVEETTAAIELIGEVLHEANKQAIWFLDRPVSNSGRLADRLRSHAREAGQSWEVRLAADVDRQLSTSQQAVASSDSRILDAAETWVNLARDVIARMQPPPWIVDLSTK